jgi:hypothetical protein
MFKLPAPPPPPHTPTCFNSHQGFYSHHRKIFFLIFVKKFCVNKICLATLLFQKDNFRKYFPTSPKFLPDEVQPALIFRQPKFRFARKIVLPGGIPLHGYSGQLVARSTSSEKA